MTFRTAVGGCVLAALAFPPAAIAAERDRFYAGAIVVAQNDALASAGEAAQNAFSAYAVALAAGDRLATGRALARATAALEVFNQRRAEIGLSKIEVNNLKVTISMTDWNTWGKD